MDAQTTTLTMRCTACGALTSAACNCGAPYEPLSHSQAVERRQAAAKALYESGMTTQRQIAEKLKVDQKTISRDFADLGIMPKSKRGRPKGAGRHRSSKRKTDAVETKIIALSDEGMSSNEIGAEVGIDGRAVRHVIEREDIQRKAKVEPEITPADLAMTAQEKLAAAIRQHQRKVDLDFERRVQAEYVARVQKQFPKLEEMQRQASETKSLYDELMRKQKKIMSVADLTFVLSCLHPDSRTSVSEDKLKRAFQLLQPKKFAITGEK